MIVITGATGQLGRRVVEQLLQRLPAEAIGASTRDPAKATDLARQGVRVRQGDYQDAASLRHAFEGASQLLLVSSNAQAFGLDPVAQHRAAIEAAKAVGVKRIVYTSHMGASATSAFPPMRTHDVTESLLRASGLAWMALRNGYYASAIRLLVGDVAAAGAVSAPADGQVCWTSHDDLAAGAAAVLADEGCFDGPTPPLTAAAALDLGDVARVFADLLQRPVQRLVVSDDEHAQRLAERGVPPTVREILMAMFRASRAGEFARVDPTLATLIGRAPQTVRDVLAA